MWRITLKLAGTYSSCSETVFAELLPRSTALRATLCRFRQIGVRISVMVISRFGDRDQSRKWCCAVSGL